jgi:nicotinate-nucleotide adenylyltransferase
VPMIHLSATYIRTCVKKEKSIRYLVPESVRKYILMHGLY